MGVTPWHEPVRAKASIEATLRSDRDADLFALAVKVAASLLGKKRDFFVHVVDGGK